MVKNSRLVTVRSLQPCLIISLSTICGANGNFDIKLVHNLDIIKKTNVWSQKLTDECYENE